MLAQKWFSMVLIGALFFVAGCGGEKVNNPVENQPENSVNEDDDNQNRNNADQDEEDNQNQDQEDEQEEDGDDGDSD